MTTLIKDNARVRLDKWLWAARFFKTRALSTEAIDKGRPENLVSFCWDGEVTKTSPTTFEMEATDGWPPVDRELEILIHNRQDPA